MTSKKKQSLEVETAILVVLGILVIISLSLTLGVKKGKQTGFQQGFNSGYQEGIYDCNSEMYDKGYFECIKNENLCECRFELDYEINNIGG